MNIETAQRAEGLLYQLKTLEQCLKDLKGNIDCKDLKIGGYNSIYLNDKEKEEIGMLLVSYYEGRLKQISNEIVEL